MTVCKPCRDDVHQGDPARTATLFAEGVVDMTRVCPGGNWCDCQHRITEGRNDVHSGSDDGP